jgi:hypothetical protein
VVLFGVDLRVIVPHERPEIVQAYAELVRLTLAGEWKASAFFILQSDVEEGFAIRVG